MTDSGAGRRAGSATRRSAIVVLVAMAAAASCAGPGGGTEADDRSWEDGAADGWSRWTSEQGMRAWDEDEDAAFSQWIGRLGEARAAGECSTLASCLASERANALWEEEDQHFSVYADCADLPYVLRAYFAYKRRLPFSFVSDISGGRYTSGNRVAAHEDWRDYGSLPSLLRAISEEVHSGFYRIAPEVEDGDHFPIEITREHVRPGTIYYDPNGHVLLVYAVDDNGTVRLMDGHPDNSLTVQRFGEKFARGNAAQGGGFRNWRHQRLEGDRVVRASNGDRRRTPGFSTEQYASSFTAAGNTVGFHEWVRFRLSANGGRRQAVEEYEEIVQGLCGDIQDRLHAVDTAVASGVHRRAHPAELPSNIYGTTGEWETYSTPSRDARLKAAFRELHRYVLATVEAVENGDESVFEFQGSVEDLLGRYREIWDQYAESDCAIAYDDSRGRPVELDLNDVMDRLFDLSFDPYHCPELRWGADPDDPEMADELASCPDSAEKLRWYRDEYRLRNRIDRDYDSRTTLDFGPEEPEDIHVPRLLDRLAAERGF
ncbi:MAG: hypothetical protein ACOY3Y_08400 [Acidobacteriota bacterium]